MFHKKPKLIENVLSQFPAVLTNQKLQKKCYWLLRQVIHGHSCVIDLHLLLTFPFTNVAFTVHTCLKTVLNVDESSP